MTSRDHYHSHRLSLWLSLIPRLHIPIEIQKQQQMMSTKISVESNGQDQVEYVTEPEAYNYEPDEYFYLRHHLLPDHENMNTYDGVVKQLTIKVPTGKTWQQSFMRQNVSSWYEQHQQLVYGKDLNQIDNGSGEEKIVHKPNGLTHGANEQYARRRIDTNNSGAFNEPNNADGNIGESYNADQDVNDLTGNQSTLTTSVLQYVS